MPQIFAIFSTYEDKKIIETNIENASLCHLLEEDVIMSQKIEDHVPDAECVAVSISMIGF